MVILRGYYAILDCPSGDQAGTPAAAARTVERALRLLQARPCMLQIRAKGSGAGELAAVARAVLPVARAAGVPLCVNDRLDVAVHLGQDDLPLGDARNVARGRLRIGISTHNLEQARAAVAGGADYLGFGPIFATTTKDRPDPVVGIEALRQVTTQVASGVPVVAIGGITLGSIADVAAAGAAAAALISAVEGAADPAAAGRAVAAAFGVTAV
ncbi:MAG: thiamine phosphate synthase [Pseudomonadota bacterium]